MKLQKKYSSIFNARTLLGVFIVLNINSVKAQEINDSDVLVFDRVFFDEKSTELTQNSKDALEYQVEWFNSHDDKLYILEGHADDNINREESMILGEKRAQAVKDYLVSKNLPSSKIHTISYGKERPAVEGDNEAAKNQNRRVITVVREAK